MNEHIRTALETGKKMTDVSERQKALEALDIIERLIFQSQKSPEGDRFGVDYRGKYFVVNKEAIPVLETIRAALTEKPADDVRESVRMACEDSEKKLYELRDLEEPIEGLDEAIEWLEAFSKSVESKHLTTILQAAKRQRGG